MGISKRNIQKLKSYSVNRIMGEGAEGGLPLQFWLIPRREGKHEIKMIVFFNPNEGKTEFLIDSYLLFFPNTNIKKLVRIFLVSPKDTYALIHRY